MCVPNEFNDKLHLGKSSASSGECIHFSASDTVQIKERGVTVSDEMIDTEKPFVDKLIKKHENVGNRRTLKDHTGRKKPFSTWDFNTNRMVLVTYNKGNYLTAVDIAQKKNTVGNPSSNHTDEMSLNHNRGWEKIPSILEAESCTPPKLSKERSNEGYRNVIAYRVTSRAIVLMTPKSPIHCLNVDDRLIFYHPWCFHPWQP